MLTSMVTDDLLSRAKGSSGMSVRALAARADVAASTITRIQAGTLAPTVGMLDRIVEAAGFELCVDVRRRGPQPPRLGDLAGAWSLRRGAPRLEWTRWRALLDHLALHPERVPDAIFVPPPPSGDRIVDALLAAVAEKLADDAGLPRPAWCALTPGLSEPYAPPARGERGPVPPQLAERGLLIDETSLWRDRRTVGV